MYSIRVPTELQGTRPEILEDYVRQRLGQFIGVYCRRVLQLAPALSPEQLERAAAEVLTTLPPPEFGPVPLESKELQLVFRHDCMALGCLDPQCALCQHNPNRRCIVNFDRKYLVNDVLKAKCGANIRVELIDRLTGLPVDEDISDLKLEMFILDGNLYDTKFLEGVKADGTLELEEDMDALMLLLNKKKSTPLLVCGAGGTNDSIGRVIVPIVRGKVALPELHVTDSSEAILSGRKPPFRLLVRAMLPESRPNLKIRHAISEGFVVATRRTRTAGKADIPSVDDHVSKLEHMGKETVKKLQDIATAAQQAGVEIEIPENCVQRVGEFKQLALRAEQDGHLRQRLQHVLKLSKEKWDEARDHAMRAVVADGRMRAWYADRRSLDVGLLFTTRLGGVELDRPVALLQHHRDDSLDGGEGKVEATLMAQLTPAQRDLVRQLQPQAAHSWWLNGHPGWAIFPMDSDQFVQSGMLEPGSYETLAAEHRTSDSGGLRGPPGPQARLGGNTSPMGSSGGGGPPGRGMMPPPAPMMMGQQGPPRPMGPGSGGGMMPPQQQMFRPPPPGAPQMPYGMPPPMMMGPPGMAPGPRGPNPFAAVAFSQQAAAGGPPQGGMYPPQQRQHRPGNSPSGQDPGMGMPDGGMHASAMGRPMMRAPEGPSSGSGTDGGDTGLGHKRSSGQPKRPAETIEPVTSLPHEALQREMMPPPPRPPLAAPPATMPPPPTDLGSVAGPSGGGVDTGLNPFMSIQGAAGHMAPLMQQLKDSGGTLDLGALPSIPIDSSMFQQHPVPLRSEDLEGHFPTSLLDNMETSLNGGAFGLLPNGGSSFENGLLQQLLGAQQQGAGQHGGQQGGGQQGGGGQGVPQHGQQQGAGMPQQQHHGGQHGGAGSSRSAAAYAYAPQIHTVTSGLDSMQSIEEALDSIKK